ncbi:MAG: hypothetical protein ACTHJQ_25310 [Rhizobiaceae bacterium]
MATDLQARLRRRAETFNTGMAVNPESIGTLGYYSGHDAALDREAADRLDALSARIQELEGVLEAKNAPRRQFPILGSNGQKIDWQLVADHGEQAQKNHYQSVERLAQRGGLSWCELYAVLHDKPWAKMDQNEAIIACRALEQRYLSALGRNAG